MTSCHTVVQSAGSASAGAIALIGHPNVGKSVLFQRLTGRYVTVSNYPGTTVEVARSAAQFLPDTAVIDTPGLLSFPPNSEDEQVAARVLLREPLRAVVQVGDAKHLRRTLLLTLQLAEMGVPLVLALNMQDEARARGVVVNHAMLAQQLEIPVIPTVATRGTGIGNLTEAIQTAPVPALRLTYPEPVEAALALIEPVLPGAPVAGRALALLWLGGDALTEAWLSERLEVAALRGLAAQRAALQSVLEAPLLAVIQQARLAHVEHVVGVVSHKSGARPRDFAAWLGRVAIHPVWGLPLLALTLYGLYWFVGVFGAGTLVGYLEETLFGEILNPWLTGQAHRLVPIPLLADLLVGEYGLWSMGMTYALALILPIVTTFFLVFSLLEDSGYLPRLSVLANRWFAHWDSTAKRSCRWCSAWAA